MSLIALFEPFLSPVRVSIVAAKSLRVLPYVWTLRAGLWTGGDAGLPLQTDWGGGAGDGRGGGGAGDPWYRGVAHWTGEAWKLNVESVRRDHG